MGWALRRWVGVALAVLVAGGLGYAWLDHEGVLGPWRFQRWLQDRPEVAGVVEFRCTEPSPDAGDAVGPGPCAVVRSAVPLDRLADLSHALAAYREEHASEGVGWVEVRSGSDWVTVTGSGQDRWLLAAVAGGLSLPEHGPVGVGWRWSTATASVEVAGAGDLMATAERLSRGLDPSGPPPGLGDGMAVVGPGGRVHVVGPSAADPLARTAFAVARDAGAPVAVLLGPGAAGPAGPAGFAVVLGPGSPAGVRTALERLGVGVPSTRSRVSVAQEPVEDVSPLFPGGVDELADPEPELGPWSATFLDDVRAVTGVGTASVAAEPSRRGPARFEAVLTVTARRGVPLRPADLVGTLPDAGLDRVVVRPAGTPPGSSPALDLPTTELRRLAPFLTALVDVGRPSSWSWLAAEDGGGRARVRLELGPADRDRLGAVLEVLASGPGQRSGAHWADLTVSVDGARWTYVVDLTAPWVGGGNEDVPQSRTEAAGRDLERDLLARWGALVGATG